MTVFNPSLDKVLVKLNTGGYGDAWSPDIIASILIASNLLDAVMADAAPGDINKLWFDPDGVTPAAGIYKIYDTPTAAWVPLTPLRFMQWLARRGGQVVPSGAIQAYVGAAAPSGWLLCNGQAVSRATYVDLFAVIGISHGAGDGIATFNLPDLRGQFLRGVDTMGTAANVDPGRTLGSRQAWATGRPQGKTPQRLIASGTTTPAFYNATNPSETGFVRVSKSGEAVTVSASGVDAPGSGVEMDAFNVVPGDAETRPVNVAVTYLIKV